MSATRQKYATALGPYGNFYARSDNCFAQSDSNPSVKLGSLFYTINTTATAITDFDDGEEGQLITIIMLDGYTSISESAEIILAGSANFQAGANKTINLINHNSAWYELARSGNVTKSTAYVSTGSAGNLKSIDVNGISLLTLTASGGAPITLQRMVSGALGQIVTVINVNSASIIINSGGVIGNIVLTASAGNYVMTGSDAASFIQASDCWREIRTS